MGHPAAPLLLLLLLLRPMSPVSPVSPTSPTPPCFPVPTVTELDLTNSTHGCPELDWGPFQHLIRLRLSHNGIAALSPSSPLGAVLEELDLSHNQLGGLPPAFLAHARRLRHLQLQYNQLRELPPDLFANATALQTLRLEGNPLLAVPPSAFQPALRLLVLPCRCDAVATVLVPCTGSCHNCTAPQCRCHTSPQHSFNVTDFHARECWGGVGVVAGGIGAVAVVVVVVVVAIVCYWRRRAATGAAGAGWGKWEPAAAHGQPRYISRATEMGATETGTAGVTTVAPDYENVFVSPHSAPAAARGWTPGWREQRYSPQVPPDDDYFLGSAAGDQPVYANTCGPPDDNVYIIPDH